MSVCMYVRTYLCVNACVCILCVIVGVLLNIGGKPNCHATDQYYYEAEDDGESGSGDG